MRTFSLLLEGGHLEDAFVYRTSLYCWTFDNKLRIYAIKDIEAAARRADPERAAAITYGLFHSRGIGSSLEQRAERYYLMDSDDDWQTEPLSISSEDIRYIQPKIRLDADALLDLLLFYDRLYLSTNGGLYSVDPFDPEEPPGQLNAKSRLRDPCYSTSGGLGSVAASLGPKGLRIFFDDVHSGSSDRRSHKAAPLSVRSELGYGTVVNYRAAGEFDFLAGRFEDTSHGRLLTNVHPAQTSYTEETARTVQHGAERKVDYAIWQHSRIVTFGQGWIESLSVLISNGARTVNRRRYLGEYPDHTRVISASRAGRFFAVETSNSVLFVDNHESRLFETGAVVSMRTFPKSQRYQRMATATTAQGLWMLGAYSRDPD